MSYVPVMGKMEKLGLKPVLRMAQAKAVSSKYVKLKYVHAASYSYVFKEVFRICDVKKDGRWFSVMFVMYVSRMLANFGQQRVLIKFVLS